MSTRCNIVVKVGQSRIFIYRHSDGYLGETGADLLLKLRAACGTPEAHYSTEGAADRFVRSLFAEYYDQQSYEKAPKAVYELTTELHGDIEHAYFVTFKDTFTNGRASIRHAQRPQGWHLDDLEPDDWTTTTKRYSLESFAKVVNKDRADMNARIRELAKESKIYADATEYEMV